MSHSMLKKSFSFNGQIGFPQEQFIQLSLQQDQHVNALSIIKEAKNNKIKREMVKKPKIIQSSRIPAEFSGNFSCNSRSASYHKKHNNEEKNKQDDCDLNNLKHKLIDYYDTNKGEQTQLKVNLSQIPNDSIERKQISPCFQQNQDQNLHDINQQRYLMKLQKKQILSANNVKQEQHPNYISIFQKINSKENNISQRDIQSLKKDQDRDIEFFSAKDQGINYEINYQYNHNNNQSCDNSNQNDCQIMKESEDNNNHQKIKDIYQSSTYQSPLIHIGQFLKDDVADNETENDQNHQIQSSRKVTFLKGISLKQLKEMSTKRNLLISPLKELNKLQSKQEGDIKGQILKNQESIEQQEYNNDKAECNFNENNFNVKNKDIIQNKNEFLKLRKQGQMHNQPVKSSSAKSIRTNNTFIFPLYKKRPIPKNRLQSSSFYQSSSCNNYQNNKSHNVDNTKYLPEIKRFQAISANSSFSAKQQSQQILNKIVSNIEIEEGKSIKQQERVREQINIDCQQNCIKEQYQIDKEGQNEKGDQIHLINSNKIKEGSTTRTQYSSNQQSQMNQGNCFQGLTDDIDYHQSNNNSSVKQGNSEKSKLKFVSSSAISALFFSVSPQKIFPAQNSSVPKESSNNQSYYYPSVQVSPERDSDSIQQRSLSPNCTTIKQIKPNNSPQNQTVLEVKKKWEQFRQKKLQLNLIEQQQDQSTDMFHTPTNRKPIKRDYPKIFEQLKHNIHQNELITIEQISKHISIVLHVPTLSLFILRTFQINESNQKSLNARISFKKSLTEKYPFLFASVYQIFNSTSQRCISVLTEYFPMKSLKIISNCCSTINEKGMQMICSQLIKKFSYMDSFELASLYLSQNNILVDQAGKIKLDCFSRESQNSQRNELLAFLIKNTSACEKSTKRKQDTQQYLQRDRLLIEDNQDCQHYLAVQLGLVMIELSIGEDFLFDYNPVQFSTFEDRQVKKKKEVSSQNKQQLCFLHEICSDRHELYNEQQTTIFKNILLRNFSPYFTDFVCECLSNSDFSELSNHPFINEQDEKVSQTTSLRELFQIAWKYKSEQTQNSEEILNHVLRQISSSLEQFPQLSTRMKQTAANLQENHPFIDFMHKDLGLAPWNILHQLKAAII